jgi:hypothetical protein
MSWCVAAVRCCCCCKPDLLQGVVLALQLGQILSASYSLLFTSCWALATPPEPGFAPCSLALRKLMVLLVAQLSSPPGLCFTILSQKITVY